MSVSTNRADDVVLRTITWLMAADDVVDTSDFACNLQVMLGLEGATTELRDCLTAAQAKGSVGAAKALVNWAEDTPPQQLAFK